MSAFFVVQVRTGFEIDVKECLKAVLNKHQNHEIKAIYAMETYTQLLKDESSVQLTEKLSKDDINVFLEVKQIRQGISNLRNSVKLLKENNNGEEDTLRLIESYQKEIRELTNKLKEYRSSSKQIQSLLKGYILIETANDYNYLPNHLWHLVKSVPHVIGFPSRYNVPKYEIEMFFESIDLTPQIEMEFNDLLITVEELETIKNALLIQSNNSNEPIHINELHNRMDLENEINNLSHYLALHEKTSSITSIQNFLSSIRIKTRCFSRTKKEIVQIPFFVFKQLFFKQLFTNFSFQCTKQEFIQRIRNYIESSIRTNTHEQVVLSTS